MSFTPILTSRLVLRRPTAADADAIFERFAADPDATRFMAWPRHRTLGDARAFMEFVSEEWRRWPAGPLLIESRSAGAVSGPDPLLLGSTGLAFETPDRASTGYILARDAWGRGYASEALRAVVTLAKTLAVSRLYADCHVAHAASARVLERCDFAREAILQKRTVFPNLQHAEPQDIARYVIDPGATNRISILPARSSVELALIAQLFREYAASLSIDLEYQGFNAELANLPGQYAPPAGDLLIATIDAEPAGCVALRPLNPTTLELKRLYVQATARSRGVGRRLVEAAIAIARRNAVRELRLDTLETMAEARALYRRLGFVEIAPYGGPFIAGTRFYGLTLDCAPAAPAGLTTSIY